MKLRDVQFDCHPNVAGKARTAIARLIYRRRGEDLDFYDRDGQCWSKAALKYELAVISGIGRKEIEQAAEGKLIAAEAVIGLISAGMKLKNGILTIRGGKS